MYPTTETQALIALKLIDGIGDRIGRKLIQHFGSATEVFYAQRKAFLQEADLSVRLYELLQQRNQALERAAQEVDFIKANNINATGILDEDYPRRLRHCHDAPFVLFTKGNMNLNTERIIGIVGTRSASSIGKKAVSELLADLSNTQLLVVSGLAHGIDGTAHQEAVNNNIATVGVMAHGLDRIYPPEHRGMAHEMLDHGGWVTDYLSNTNPDKGNFPERNRIVAGLCDAVIVVESKRKGGSMITAELAYGYHRDVFAFPGRFNDANYEGCNYLIKTQRAQLITGAEDLLYQMNWKRETSTKTIQQPQLLFELSTEEEGVLHQLREHEQLSLDELAGQLAVPVSTLSIHLLNLELNGLISVLPGKVYKLN